MQAIVSLLCCHMSLSLFVAGRHAVDDEDDDDDMMMMMMMMTTILLA